MLKKVVRKVFESAGYDLVPRQNGRQPDLTAYRDLCDAETLARKPFYNVGAGSFRHPYWTNVDKPSEWYAGQQQDDMIAYDLMELTPLPIADDSAKLVYTSHTMEHIPNAAAAYFYREAQRILEPGGLLRVTVPNAELFYRAYRARDRHFDNMVVKYNTAEKAATIRLDRPANQMSSQQLFLWRIAATASVHHTDSDAKRVTDEEIDRVFDTLPFDQAMDYCTARCDTESQKRNPGCHINWWTWEKLSSFLREAGFSDVRRCGYGQSASPLMRDKRYFDSTRPESSLYVEAQK